MNEEQKIIFATPETIRQPKGNLILVEQDEADYVLGSKDPKNLGQAVVSSGHWASYAPITEIQRVIDGDTFGCTGFSDNNVDEFIHKAKYGTEINISDMFVVVGSGNRRGVGNTMKAPAEFKRKNGFVFEEEYPYSRSMTLDQFYAPIPQKIYDLAKLKLNIYDSGYLQVNGAGQQSLLDALPVSPIKVAVEGSYTFDANGRVRNTGSSYNHAVVIFDYVLDESGGVKEWWIYDSENNQFVKFRGDYAFMSPMVKFLEKKTMNNLYRVAGQAAIGLYVPDAGGIVLFRDGKDVNDKNINGGSVFKAFGWTYSNAQVVKEWPYPIVGEIGVDGGGFGAVSEIVPIDHC